MSKTLIYASGSPTNVKIGDTDTSLYLQAAKDNANVDLTSVTSITVKIADANKNYLKDISISSSSLPDGDKGILVLPLNSDNIGGLNSGDYYFEVWIITADNETEIYPDMNVTKFHVFNNIVGGTSILTTLAMQAFLDKITANQTASETSLANSKAALAAANAANSGATQALNDLNAGNYLTEAKLPSSPTFVGLQTQVNNSAVGMNLIIAKAISPKTTFSGTSTVAFANGFITDYIPVIAGKTYTVSIFETSSAYVSRIALYDSSKNFVSRLPDVSISTSSPQKITIPNGIYYIRFSPNTPNNTGTYDDNFKIEKGTMATDWNVNPSDLLTESDYAKIQAAIVALGGSLS